MGSTADIDNPQLRIMRTQPTRSVKFFFSRSSCRCSKGLSSVSAQIRSMGMVSGQIMTTRVHEIVLFRSVGRDQSGYGAEVRIPASGPRRFDDFKAQKT